MGLGQGPQPGAPRASWRWEREVGRRRVTQDLVATGCSFLSLWSRASLRSDQLTRHFLSPPGPQPVTVISGEPKAEAVTECPAAACAALA